MDQLAQQRSSMGTGIDDAAACVEDRALCLGHEFDGRPDPVHVALDGRAVGLVLVVEGARVGAALELNVLRQIDHHGSRPAVGRHIERLVQDARQVLDRFDEIIVLRAVAGDADRIAFLEGVGPDEVGRHLTRDADDRDRIHHRVGKTGHGIRCTGTRGHQNHADLAGGTGIALRRMHGALLVAHEDVLDLILVEDRIVNGKNGPTGITEDMLDSLVLQSTDHHFGSGHRLAHVTRSVGSVFVGWRNLGNKKGP
jgi:hypothetical protein